MRPTSSLLASAVAPRSREVPAGRDAKQTRPVRKTLSRTWSGARNYLVGGGAVHLVLWVYGLLIDKESVANFVPVNAADDWLHLGLGAGMVALGLVLSRRRESVDTSDGPGRTSTLTPGGRNRR